jgi:hypothetical protein
LYIRANFSKFISRIRRSWQYAAAPAGIHRLKPELLCSTHPGYLLNLYQLGQWVFGVCGGPGRHSPAKAGIPGWHIRVICSTFISRIGRSRQYAAAPTSIHRLKPGLQDGISGLSAQTSSGA